MDLNKKRAETAVLETGAATAGAVIGYALSNKATELATDKAPSVAKHVPAIMLATILALQAFDMVPENPMLESALQGAAVVSGMQTVREYTGANTAAAKASNSGLPALVNKFVPAFQATAALPASTTPAPAGTNGLGYVPLQPYRDPAEAARLAGEYQQRMVAAPLRSLGAAPVRGGGLQDLG
jgi:hypothetical protein